MALRVHPRVRASSSAMGALWRSAARRSCSRSAASAAALSPASSAALLAGRLSLFRTTQAPRVPVPRTREILKERRKRQLLGVRKGCLGNERQRARGRHPPTLTPTPHPSAAAASSPRCAAGGSRAARWACAPACGERELARAAGAAAMSRRAPAGECRGSARAAGGGSRDRDVVRAAIRSVMKDHQAQRRATDATTAGTGGCAGGEVRPASSGARGRDAQRHPPQHRFTELPHVPDGAELVATSYSEGLRRSPRATSKATQRLRALLAFDAAQGLDAATGGRRRERLGTVTDDGGDASVLERAAEAAQAELEAHAQAAAAVDLSVPVISPQLFHTSAPSSADGGAPNPEAVQAQGLAGPVQLREQLPPQRPASSQLVALKSELKKHIAGEAELRQMNLQLSDRLREVERLRTDSLAAAEQEFGKLEAALKEHAIARADSERRAEQAQQALKDAQRRAASAATETRSSLQSEIAVAHEAREKANREAESARADLEATRAALEATRIELEAGRVEERATAAMAVERARAASEVALLGAQEEIARLRSEAAKASTAMARLEQLEREEAERRVAMAHESECMALASTFSYRKLRSRAMRLLKEAVRRERLVRERREQREERRGLAALRCWRQLHTAWSMGRSRRAARTLSRFKAGVRDMRLTPAREAGLMALSEGFARRVFMRHAFGEWWTWLRQSLQEKRDDARKCARADGWRNRRTLVVGRRRAWNGWRLEALRVRRAAVAAVASELHQASKENGARAEELALENVGLVDRLHELTSALADAHTQLGEARDRGAQLEVAVAEGLSRETALKDELGNAAAATQALEASLRTAQGTAAEKERACSSLEHRASQLEAEIKARTSALTECESALMQTATDLEGMGDEYEGKLSSMAEIASSLRGLVSEKSAALEAMAADRATLESKADEEVRRRAADNTAMTKMLDQSEARRLEAEARCEQWQETAHASRAASDEAAAAVLEWKARAEDAMGRVSVLETEVKTWALKQAVAASVQKPLAAPAYAALPSALPARTSQAPVGAHKNAAPAAGATAAPPRHTPRPPPLPQLPGTPHSTTPMAKSMSKARRARERFDDLSTEIESLQATILAHLSTPTKERLGRSIPA